MTLNEGQILLLLMNGERYGNQMLQNYEREFGSPIKRPTLYTVLERLEDAGLVKSRMGAETHERGGARRQYFRITAEGENALDAFHAQVRPFSETRRTT